MIPNIRARIPHAPQRCSNQNAGYTTRTDPRQDLDKAILKNKVNKESRPNRTTAVESMENLRPKKLENFNK